MGCSGSKLNDLPAVALCRRRTELIEEAIRQRYAMADAHREYSRALIDVGVLLQRLIDCVSAAADILPPSPVLPLPPPERKPSPSPPPPAAVHPRSRSNSGSHIHFDSSDDSESDTESPMHSGAASPVQHNHHHHLHYSRSQPTTASVTFEHRPQSPESSNFVYSSYLDQNPSFYPYAYNYNFASSSYSDYEGGMLSGFWGSRSPPVPEAVAEPSPPSSAPIPPPPPPPPPPPSSSSWDFLNLFESYDSYYPPYTPSRSSKEVRDEEGIPDLEEDEHEVVKEVHGDQKFTAASASAAGKEKVGVGVREDPPYKLRQAESGRDGSANGDAPVEEKNVVSGGDEVVEEMRNSVAIDGSAAPARKYESISEVATEIRTQFERASDTINDLSGILEVGKLPYHRRNPVYQVSSRIICVITHPSDAGELLVFDEDSNQGSKVLSSTLQKLFIWEKKLYDEVKAEEKMRILHDRKCMYLKTLDETGAEAHKIDSTHAAIRKLSTKIRIAIQIVESISKKINNLRDAELWPLINELIQGFFRMWRAMLECHRTQCCAISEAKNLNLTALGRMLSDDHMELILKLELELLHWIGSFATWVTVQKNYVKALNGWLKLCLHYEPEETSDGVAPFSPGRIGAPPVFVVCNYWSQLLDQISETEAITALNSFAANLRLIWEQKTAEQRLRLAVGNEPDGSARARDRGSLLISRAVDSLNKKLVSVTGQDGGLALYDEGRASMAGDVEHLGLKRVFEAMESFTTNTAKAYEELHARTVEEERRTSENAKAP